MNGKKILNLDTILNYAFINKFMKIFGKLNCNLIQNLFEVFIERIALKYKIIDNQNVNKSKKFIESSYKM